MTQITSDRSSRNLAGWDFFLLWAGAAIALPEIWAGGLLTSQGLLHGLIAILLGHLIGNLVMGGGGWIGSRHGIPAITSTRNALGHKGAYLAGGLNVIQLLGWTGFMIWIATQAVMVLPQTAFFGKTGWTLLIGGCTTLWALGGHTLWRPLQRIGVLLLLALTVLMTWRVLTTYSLSSLFDLPRDPSAHFLLGLDAVIVMPISWLPLVADYARYARADRPCFTGTFWGYFVGGCWMYAVGLIAALATQSNTPDSMVVQLMANTHLAGVALFIILLSTFTTTFLDVFSAAVSAQSIWPRLPERMTIAIMGIAGTLLALWFDAMSYEPFLLFIGAAFCPLFGIVLTDYFIVKRGLFAPADGFRARALIAWAMGFILYRLCIHFAWPTGASIPAFAGAALIYLALSYFHKDSKLPS